MMLIVIALGLVLLPNIKLNADTGPKSYVRIEIVGETKGYYLTLLGGSAAWGPHSGGREADEIDLKFKEYSEHDDFDYWNSYSSIEDHEYTWGYYPPDTFKILIYDSINDRFITDNVVYYRTSFATELKLTLSDDLDSDTPFDVTNNAPFTVTKSANYLFRVILGFVLRLTLCISIELGMAFLFKFKEKQYLVVIGANLFTQIVLNLCLALMIYQHGFQVFMVYPLYIITEFLIIFIEWLIYGLTLNKVNRFNNIPIYKSFLYSLAANVSSFALGFIILYALGF